MGPLSLNIQESEVFSSNRRPQRVFARPAPRTPTAKPKRAAFQNLGLKLPSMNQDVPWCEGIVLREDRGDQKTQPDKDHGRNAG